MAYEKYEWQRGEIITSDKLNHIENGIEEVDNKIDSEIAYEITDARVGADGITYSTLGDAVRKQITDLKVKFTNIVTPDQFTGTDSQKLAEAINSLVDGGIVLLERTYTLTEDVVIDRISSAARVTVKGVNSSGLIDCSNYTFTGTNHGNDGNICFDGVIFTGDKTNGLFDAYYLIRIYCTNCSFSNFTSLVYNSRSNQERVYIQSYYFTNCCIRHIYDYIIKLTNEASTIDWIIDVRFTENNIEWCHSGLVYANCYQGFYFINNALEGFTTPDPLVSKVKVARPFVFSDNYFEKNNCEYFDFAVNTMETMNVEISRNLFMENTAENINFIKMPLVKTEGLIKISNNTVVTKASSGCCFVYVDDSTSQQLSTVQMEGNCAPSVLLTLKHDNNNLISTAETFQELNDRYKIISKINSCIDTSSGKTITISLNIMGTALNSSTLAMIANIPIASNNYSAEIINVSLVNLGDITSKTAVYGDVSYNGFEMRATNLSVTPGATFTGTAAVKLTFI